MKPLKFSFNDFKTLDLFKKGKLDSISAITVKENNGKYELSQPLQYYKQINDLTYEDIIVINSIYQIILRLDNLSNDTDSNHPSYLMNRFIKRRNGEEPFDYFHPSLKPILEITCGAFIYREQLYATAILIGELSDSEAELFVKKIGNHSLNKSDSVYTKFFNNANKIFVDTKIIDLLFEEIKKCLFVRFTLIEPLVKEMYIAAWIKAHYGKMYERNPREVRRIVRVLLFKENNISKFYRHSQNFYTSIFGSENIEKTDMLLSTVQINNKLKQETPLSPLKFYDIYSKSIEADRKVWQFFVKLYIYHHISFMPEKAKQGILLQQIMQERIHDEALNMNFSDDFYSICVQIKNEINEITHKIPVPQIINQAIDVKENFISFRERMQNKYGEIYNEQTDIMFEYAVNEAKKFPFSAIKDARVAYALSQFATGGGNPLYILGFLTEVHIEINKFKKAQSYLNICYKLLDSNDTDYADDKAKLDEMQDIINGEMWKDTD